MKHIFEYSRFVCVFSTLFPDRSNIKRDDPITNLDGYSNDVLTMYGIIMFARKPAIYKTDESAQSVYYSIINVEVILSLERVAGLLLIASLIILDAI